VKYIIIAITAVVLMSVGGYVVVSNKSDSQQKNSSAQTQSMVEKVEANNAQLVDVRTPQEYNASYAKKSINIPLDEIQKGDLSKFDKDKPIYLYCRTGRRAGEAKTILEQAGYKDVTNIGGLDDWKNQGGTVVVN